MISAEIRAKYFADLSGRLLRRQRLGTWFTLLFASSSVVSLLATIPKEWAWIRLILAVGATATSIYMALAGNIQKAFDCSNLHERLSRLHQGYQGIWEDIEAPDAPMLLQELDSRQIEISKSSISLPYNKKAMGKWQTHTEREHGLLPVA